MSKESKRSVHQRWAHLRFSVVGPLLASPPSRGQLQIELKRLSEKTWIHPITGKPTRFGVSTIERWFYQAKNGGNDPVGTLRRKVRRDSGGHPAVSERFKPILLTQYQDHPGWSVQLHRDNLEVRVEADSTLGPMPSYSSLRRFLHAHGLYKRPRKNPKTEGERRAVARREQREVRSFEAEHVHGLWHTDFHRGSRSIVTSSGERVHPWLLGVLDDRSRLACHLQWYLRETAENLVHGLSQAFQKRELPRALMSDNGSAMTAAETTEGLARLGILHQLILAHSPYQNAKQEVFWVQIERRLLAMMENCPSLTLAQLNEATQAWVELEYNRKLHSEIGQTPLERYLAGPDLGRPAPDSETLRRAFGTQVARTQRRSDGTISVEGQRFEIPSRYRHLSRVTIRLARWDLSRVWLVDPRTDTLLSRIYPLDKSKNADGRRRALSPVELAGTPRQESLFASKNSTESGMAPLLRKLMADYAATGLPPAYLPKDESSAASESKVTNPGKDPGKDRS